ncbi:unnamed protein product [Fraxinus pennsylvanica]|uniref:Vacuolar fusion protein MON1 homolog n=1 Tax=Fraxinus pennsylvanica TaxID=56036 RepID=A0AAD1ZKK2_9LAMI|nr:unnamed protein product [Fraxinus pennsylvanica]
MDGSYPLHMMKEKEDDADTKNRRGGSGGNYAQLMSFGLSILHIYFVTRGCEVSNQSIDIAVLLCWVTEEFELYAAFDPLAERDSAIKTCNRVCRWVKAVENDIFLLGASSFSW